MSEIIPIESLSGSISAQQELSGSMESEEALEGGLSLDTRREIEVIDNLESTDTQNALSANMGRVLNEKIDNSGFITEEVDPTVPLWAKEETKPNYTPEEVGAVNANNQMSLEAIDAMFAAVFGGQ